jgi:hypothetical protein
MKDLSWVSATGREKFSFVCIILFVTCVVYLGLDLFIYSISLIVIHPMSLRQIPKHKITHMLSILCLGNSKRT